MSVVLSYTNKKDILHTVSNAFLMSIQKTMACACVGWPAVRIGQRLGGCIGVAAGVEVKHLACKLPRNETDGGGSGIYGRNSGRLLCQRSASLQADSRRPLTYHLTLPQAAPQQRNSGGTAFVTGS